MLATELTAVFTTSRRINISEMLGNCYQICALSSISEWPIHLRVGMLILHNIIVLWNFKIVFENWRRS